MMETITRILTQSATGIIVAAVLLSIFASESSVGDEIVNIPRIKNWWEREIITKLPHKDRTPFITAAYFFPFLCSIVFYNKTRMETGLLVGEWVSACTIFSTSWVAFSIDSMDRPSDDHAGKFHDARYHHTIHNHDLQVVHGTVYGSPSVDFQNQFIKKNIINHLWYLNSLDQVPSRIELDDSHIDERFNISRIFQRNALNGTETGVAFARVKEPFHWDAYTLPAPFISRDARTVKQKFKKHLEFLEEQTYQQKACYVGGYHRFTKKMKWYQVMYIPHEECREVYCTYNAKACLVFPVKEHHVCFKSLVYGDLCPEDRGTAVYCPDFEHSIFGILTTAPNCGWKNLPNVYTRIDVVHDLIWNYHSAPTPREEVTAWRYPEDLRRYTLLPPGMVRRP